MPKISKHLHRYKRIKLGQKGYTVYKCMQPGCAHYIRTELVQGAICECNRCGQPMIMDKKAMTLARPHCEDCTKTRSDKDIKKINDFLEGIL